MSNDGRAWVEIDLDALAYNSVQLRSLMPQGCELMAVVKADAYGHGADRVAARLFDEGVRAFAVATVGEGVRLREFVPEGEIIVLGYTNPKDAGFLRDFRLTQLIVDGAYAKALNDTGYSIYAHISIDTGMHREGVPASDLTEIESIYARNNLNITGIETHLASSDSLDIDDVRFTNSQIERFFSTVEALRKKGYCVGSLHIQASYGLLNYPDTKCDCIRAGIALYGVLSHDEDTVIKPALKPVLALKAVVAQVRWIEAGEGVSYGRTFTADKPLKLATVCIGYADGVPRHMSGNGGMCLVRGHKVPIIGRICMDLLMLDVTDVETVEQGDIVTLIGRDGSEEIRCEDFARASDTISNDILCRLGCRLPRVYFG